MSTYHVIGQPIPRVDGAAKAMGHARYAADVSLPGTLWGKSLHSPYAHARIVRIDTTAARQVPACTQSSRVLRCGVEDCGAGR